MNERMRANLKKKQGIDIFLCSNITDPKNAMEICSSYKFVIAVAITNKTDLHIDQLNLYKRNKECILKLMLLPIDTASITNAV